MTFPRVHYNRGDRALRVVDIESAHVRLADKFGVLCLSEAKSYNLEVGEPSMPWSKFAEWEVKLMLTLARPSTKRRHEEVCAASVRLESVQVPEVGRKAIPVWSRAP